MLGTLGPNLVVKKSPIHGNGLFACKDFEKGTIIGLGWVICYHENSKYYDKVRTALGANINHSNTPNVDKSTKVLHNLILYQYVIANRSIRAGEELTIFYEDTNPEEDNVLNEYS